MFVVVLLLCQQAGTVSGILTVVARPCHWTISLAAKRSDDARTESDVSLYFTDMSAAVRRMAAIASSSVTLYTPSLAMASWAAVTALTAPNEFRSYGGVMLAFENVRGKTYDARNLHQAVDRVAC